MDNFEKLISELSSMVERYKYKPIESGEMIRMAQNPDEIVIFLSPKYKGKNILIIYNKD